MPDHNMPSTQDVQQLWTAEGLRLSHAERDQPWLCGKWWNSGEALGHGARKRIVTSPEWKAAGGLAHGTMRNRGAVTRRFPEVSLRSDISYSHHAAVMCLKDDAAAHAVLADAIRYGWSDNRTAIEAKRIKFGYYVTHSADIETGLGGLIQRKEMFGGVCADVPWEFDECLVKWGADIHYRSMPDEQLAALPVRQVCTDHTTLFLWTPTAMIQRAFPLMEAWGFRWSQSEIIWLKTPNKPTTEHQEPYEPRGSRGTGYRPRMVHEHLLIGIREMSPTWLGSEVESVITAPRPGRHSQKPDKFYSIIERVVPGPYLELFGRKERKGWTVVGDQISPR
jgi:N6-adenosine-specific RNA methylase IME4